MTLLDATAAQHGAGEAETELIRAADLSSVREDWRALFDSSIECNPFYGPDLLEPLASGDLADPSFRVLVAWRRNPQGRRHMTGFMPLRVSSARFMPARGFVHHYVVGAGPLLHKDDPEAAALALMDGLRAQTKRSLLILDDLRLDWPAWRAFAAAAKSSGRLVEECDVFERAGVSPESGTAHVKGKVAQNLRRCRTKLSQLGSWSVTTPRTVEEAHAAQEALLQIEASGWKGEAATALASRPETLAFARTAFDPANTRPEVRYFVLSLDGAPIAVSMVFVAPGLAANLKCAYDENFAACSPGVLLDAATADEVRSERFTPFLDSVALAGHPVERLWPERLRCGWVAVGCDPSLSEAEFRIHLSIERLRRYLREAVKDSLAVVRKANGSTARLLARTPSKD